MDNTQAEIKKTDGQKNSWTKKLVRSYEKVEPQLNYDLMLFVKLLGKPKRSKSCGSDV